MNDAPRTAIEKDNTLAHWAVNQATKPGAGQTGLGIAITFALLAIAEELRKIRKTMLALEGAEDRPE